MSSVKPKPRAGNWLLLAGLLLVAAVGTATEIPGAEPFTEARFDTLRAQGQLVLVDIAADWCPTCRRQREVLAAFQDRHADAGLHILTVDFDRQKEWVRHFKAPRQSTFILFRGDEQLWFAVAEVRETVIFDQLLRAAGLAAAAP